jgi:putative PIN family toxin of toxin-antitoxin system
MRVFLDTNVLVSAFTARGLCADLLRTVLLEHELLSSEVVLKELQRVLVQKLRMPDTAASKIIHFLREEAVVVNPKSPAPWPISDPDDQWILASALEAKADILVSGDKDLLEIGNQAPVQITDPRGFWTLLRKPK